MKYFILPLFLCTTITAVLFFTTLPLYAEDHPASPYIQYVHPAPDSRQNSLQTNIAVRFSESVDPASAFSRLVSITGSSSGVHSARMLVSDDGKTIVVQPYVPFHRSENVTVRLSGGITTAAGSMLPEYSFSFSTAEHDAQSIDVTKRRERELIESLPDAQKGTSPVFEKSWSAQDFPSNMLTVTHSTAPSSGYIFLSNFVLSSTGYKLSPYLMIVDNYGTPLYYREVTTLCYDFKMQPNGQLTYWDSYFRVLDSSYSEVDQIVCRNGYDTDPHELRLLPNGHMLLLGYDIVVMDMSQTVEGGKRQANVIGTVIQELDNDKNVVFQWRSFDHFDVTDATYTEFRDYTIDAVHGNSLDLDRDGNIILSSRNLDEITKIDRTTGKVIWRFGGKKNQFTFLNDTIGFSRQHAARVLENGHITLFDNGNHHSPSFSRAVEYALDEQNMTATLVWQYRETPDIYGNAMGYVQRLKNGNTFISWGTANPTMTEVTEGGNKVFEMTLPEEMYTYRAMRCDWLMEPTAVQPRQQQPSSFELYQNYPNPFNPATKINYSLPSAAHVEITVHDMLGRTIATLVNEELPAGLHTAEWTATGCTSGVYCYRIRSGPYTESKKMLLLK